VRTGERAVLRLEGELDYAARPVLSRALSEVLAHAPRAIDVEARELHFADVAGLHPLIDLAERMGPGAVRLRETRPFIARVLQVLHLDHMLA
jgi:anti-anti-sigma factor